MRLETVPFAAGHIDAAAVLLAARHRRDRMRTPSLPNRLEAVPAARTALTEAFASAGAAGVTAWYEGGMVGYVLGRPRVGSPWRRSAWVGYTGHAVGVDGDEGACSAVYREMYAALAPRWIAAGLFAHYVLVPAADRVTLDAWWSLGFGQEQAHALRPLASAQPLPETGQDPDIEIRRGLTSDLEAVQRLAVQLPRHQAASPTFAAALPEFIAEIRAGHAELLADPAATYWLACRAQRVVAMALLQAEPPGPTDGLLPDGCIELVVAITDEGERGHGIGAHLVEHALARAHAAGFAWCAADWRTANLAAARFWPRHGFQPVAYRLSRSVDARIAWANERD